MIPAVDYLLIGHITADVVDHQRDLGGTVSYAARVAHAFGLSVGILTSAAAGEPLLAGLSPYAQIECLSANYTTTFENIYQPEGRIQYVRGTAAAVVPDQLPPQWSNAPLVHLAPIADEVSPDFVHRFPNALTLLTLQGWMRRLDADGRVMFKPWTDFELLRAVDIVVFSEEDIREAPQLEQQCAQSARLLVVTRGENGGTYYLDGHQYHYPAVPAVVTHLTGAGDVFAASLLASLYRLSPRDRRPSLQYIQTAIQVSAQLAAYSVTRTGLASAPTSAEIQSVICHIIP